MGIFSTDGTPLEGDLLVAEGGLSFFLYGDTSLNREVIASSLVEDFSHLAFLFSRIPVKDFSC